MLADSSEQHIFCNMNINKAEIKNIITAVLVLFKRHDEGFLLGKNVCVYICYVRVPSPCNKTIHCKTVIFRWKLSQKKLFFGNYCKNIQVLLALGYIRVSHLASLQQKHISLRSTLSDWCVCVCQSSLLSAILGELSHEGGVVKVRGELTYTSQQPWILPGTIRSNILFGKALNPQKYERVLQACALKRVRVPTVRHSLRAV